MPVAAVFFDVGGVLEVTPSTGWVDRWETRKRWPAGELERRAADVFAAGAIGALSEQEVEDRLRQVLALSQRDVAALMDDLWAEYLGSPNADLIDYMASLRGRVKVGIISNSFVGAREREQERYRFGDLTDAIAYSHEVGSLKPDPAIYLRACDSVAVSPSEAVLVDDWRPAVDGALAVGMAGVLYEDNEQAMASIERLL
jgi:putative hydrolase of the HAD superfamily